MTDPTTLSLVVERTWTWHKLKRSSSSTLQDCWHGPAFHNEHMCSINTTSWWPFASGKLATTLDPQNSRIHQQSERPKVKWKVPQPVPFRLKFKAEIWDGELLGNFWEAARFQDHMRDVLQGSSMFFWLPSSSLRVSWSSVGWLGKFM